MSVAASPGGTCVVEQKSHIKIVRRPFRTPQIASTKDTCQILT